MPAAAPALAATAFTVAGVKISVGTVLAVTFGVGLQLFSALAMRPDGPGKPSDGQQNIRQAVPSRRRHYGRVRVGGSAFLFEAKGGKLYFGIALGQGRVTGLVQHYLNENPVDVDGSGNVTSHPYAGFAKLFFYDGQDSQTADPTLLADIPEAWTADHRLRGIAYILGVFSSPSSSQFNAVYPDGRPIINAVIDGAAIYDPRTGVTAWSDNPALVLADYITSPEGMNRPAAKLDLAGSWSTAADVCDELVALKGGGTEKRYRCSFSYDLLDDPAEVVQSILDTMGGEFFYTPDGKLGLRAAAYTAPTVTLDLDRHGRQIEVVRRSGALTKYNTLVAVYTDPALGYKETEAQAWEDAALLAEQGRPITERLEIFGCPSPGQGRRLAKIRTARDNPEWRITAEMDLAGWKALGKPFVQAVYEELGIDAPFRVVRADLSATGVTFELESVDPAAWTWDAATEEGEPPGLPPAVIVESIEIPDVTEAASVVSISTWWLQVTVATPSRQDLTLELQYRRIDPLPVLGWQSLTVEAGETVISTPVLQDCATYEYRLRWLAPDATSGEWTDVEEAYGCVDAAAPGSVAPHATPLVDFVGSHVLVRFTQPPQAGVNRAEIFRDGASIAVVFAAPGAAVSYNDFSAPEDTLLAYSARALNTAGVAGPTVALGSIFHEAAGP